VPTENVPPGTSTISKLTSEPGMGQRRMDWENVVEHKRIKLQTRADRLSIILMGFLKIK